MIPTKLALALVTGMIATATAIPSSKTTQALSAPIDGYSVTELTWELEVDPINKPGQVTVFNGTVQNVVEQAVKINPNFLVDHGFKRPNDDDNATVVGHDGNTLSTATVEPDRHFCHGRWEPGSSAHIKDGVEYLRRISGKPGQGPGPSSCGRVSCSWDSAIWWCNDVGYMVQQYNRGSWCITWLTWDSSRTITTWR